MNIAGIVCEYNPFHSGHKYHIDTTRQILGTDTGIVSVMSGNFVQRGDAAMFSKHTRAKAAIMNGADLVLELPVPWVLSSAEGFAYGAVSILNALGATTHLSFGSESGDINDLKELTNALDSSESDIKDLMATGMSYASARQKSVEQLSPALGALMSEPNNLLAVEYIRALNRLNSPIEPITVTRCMTKHDGSETCGGFASASYIRSAILGGENPSEFIPDSVWAIFTDEISKGNAPHKIKNSELAILSKLRTMSEAEYNALPGASEGLGQRLMQNGRQETSLAAIMEKTKSKRYPMSRIRRMIMCAWLGITADNSIGAPPYIRVLAANKKGCEILKAAKEKFTLPIITKPAAVKNLSAEENAIFDLEARATALFNLTSPVLGKGGAEWSTSPIIYI